MKMNPFKCFRKCENRMLQLHGDLKDLRYKFKKPKVSHKLFNKNNGHCSALVKVDYFLFFRNFNDCLASP